MFDWLDRLRERPESVRFRAAVLGAFIFTFIIFLVWLSVLTLRFGDSSGKNIESPATEVRSPLTPFREVFSRTFQDGKSIFLDFKDNFNSFEYDNIEDLESSQ